MKPNYYLITILAGLLQTVGFAALDADRQEVDYDRYDAYQVISQCNVFSRDRITPSMDPENQIETIPVDKIVASYVLKGVAANGSHLMAFVEDVVSGEFMQVAAGTRLSNGTIKDIQHNHIVYEENGESRPVDIGDNFCRTVIQVQVSAESPQAVPARTERTDNTF